MPVRQLPKILTVTDWNAKKGVIAKMAGETGIGAQLTELKGVWEKTPWQVLDPDQAVLAAKVTRGSSALIDTLQPAAKAQYGKIEALRKELFAFADFADKVEAKFKKSKVIPSSSTRHVKNMAAEARNFATSLKNIGEDWANVRKLYADQEAKNKAMALQTIKPYFVSIRDYGKQALKNPTVAQYKGEAKKGFHQNIRGISAALDRMQDPALAAWKDTNWRPLAIDSFIPKNDGEVSPKVNFVLGKVDELERMVG
jgi:hypothetical protein